MAVTNSKGTIAAGQFKRTDYAAFNGYIGYMNISNEGAGAVTLNFFIVDKNNVKTRIFGKNMQIAAGESLEYWGDAKSLVLKEGESLEINSTGQSVSYYVSFISEV
jgi:hypothetical protein